MPINCTVSVIPTFLVHTTRGQEQTIYSGHNRHSLRRDETGFDIRRKKVMLTNAAEPLGNIYFYL